MNELKEKLQLEALKLVKKFQDDFPAFSIQVTGARVVVQVEKTVTDIEKANLAESIKMLTAATKKAKAAQ